MNWDKITGAEAIRALTRDDDGRPVFLVLPPRGEQPYAPPYDEHSIAPDASLRCAVTGSVDVDPTCGCAGCSAGRVRQR